MLVLTDQDLDELQRLMDDMLLRPKDGARLMAFFQTRLTRDAQRKMAMEAAKAKAPPAAGIPNGHDANPYQAQA